MNVGEFLESTATVDLLVILFLFGMFVLGFIQGTIRRLLGIGSILFSFLVAANVKEPLGGFLGANWTQFSPEYAEMIGFLTVFVAASIAFSIVIQGTYRKAPLFEKATFVDEVIGGFLGLVQGLMILTFLMIVLDTFFLLPGIAPDDDEIQILRDFWTAISEAGIGGLLHETIIPRLLAIGGFLVPLSIRELYPRV